MNVSAKYLIWFLPSHTPVWVGGTFSQLKFFGWRLNLVGFSDSTILLITPLSGVWLESSTESLILAQDERWRRA